MSLYEDGGYYPPPDYTDGMSPQQLKSVITTLTADNEQLKAQIALYKSAPIRRMWNSFYNVASEWIGPAILVSIIGIGCAAAYIGSNVRVKRAAESCAFVAKIQDTKFEFDTINEKCYLYDKSFNRYIPHALSNP